MLVQFVSSETSLNSWSNCFFLLSLSVVYWKSGQFFSDFIYILQISFIIAAMIIHGSVINLCGYFFSFSYKISISLCCHFCIQWVGWHSSLSSPRLFFNCHLQRVFANWLYIWFVFLACKNITLTYAIFHPISSFYFSNYNAVANLVQMTRFVVGKYYLDLLTHFQIWAMEYSLLLWMGGVD